MHAVDTNVLLRLILDDDEEQSKVARALLRTEPVYVSSVVLAEASWVLESGYGFSREKLAEVVSMLLETEGIELQDAPLVEGALSSFQSSKADFSDCLILAASQSKGLVLATFDEKLGRLRGTRKLGRKRKR